MSACDFCGKETETRPFYRYTNPQSGEWCRDCRDQWECAVLFDSAACGSILSDGWSDDEGEGE